MSEGIGMMQKIADTLEKLAGSLDMMLPLIPDDDTSDRYYIESAAYALRQRVGEIRKRLDDVS